MTTSTAYFDTSEFDYIEEIDVLGLEDMGADFAQQIPVYELSDDDRESMEQIIAEMRGLV